MTQQAQARNRVFGVRTLLKSLGLIGALTLGVALIDSEHARRNAAPLIYGAAALTAISLWLMVWKLPEERGEYSGRGAKNPFAAIRDVWRNRLARTVLIVYFIEMLGVGGIGVLVPYVVEYVLEMPGKAALFLGVYGAAQIAGIPLWVKLGDRFEKQNLWLFAMGQSLVGFGLMIFISAGNWLLMVVASLLAGSAGSCSNTIGVSLKADIIDTDELATGERKEGSFFAAWSFANKLASGLMLGIVGVALEVIGYVPNQEQSESVRSGMLFLMGGLPMIGYGIGMAIFSRFDLKRAEHARIRAEIDARR
jgi:Na+/melibiose symporter-like transporter